MKNPPLYLLCLLVGVLLVIVGLVLNPSFVANYIKHVETLYPSGIDKVLSYQLYAITLGFLVIFLSILVYSGEHVKIVFIPVLIVYLVLVYSFYINKKYPENILLKPSDLSKASRLLLGEEILLSDYQPRAMLEVKNHKVIKAKYPVIDVHFHLGSMKNLSAEELIRAMDACGIAKVVNLDGAPGDLEKYIRDFKEEYPERFIMFARVNFGEIDDPNFSENQIALLEHAVKMGAQGLKVTKDLGLGIRDRSGKLVALDDPRIDPIWDRAGELGIPVLIHAADPTPFFEPVDRYNERYEELRENPQWSFYGPQFPRKETLLSQRENLLREHPKTIFIGAHMGDNPEDLDYVGYLLDRYPNYYVDISSRLPELGRQPFTTRRFFIKYQDRILFGSDGGYALGTNGWSAERYFRTYFEFLETDNEYFEYPLWGINKQGMWRIYGINLPDEVLEKIYHRNAEKLIH